MTKKLDAEQLRDALKILGLDLDEEIITKALGKKPKGRPSNNTPFTKRAIEALEITGKQYSVSFSTETPGLTLVVNPGGSKTFVLYRFSNGRPERIKLDTFHPETTSLEAIKKKAAKALGAFAEDKNPAAAKRALRGEPTFAEAFEKFIKEKRNLRGEPLAESTVEDYRGTLKNHLGAIAKRKLSEIDASSLGRLKIASAAQNNRARALISGVFKHAISKGLTETKNNPASGMANRHIEERERFLLPDEAEAFFEAVENSSRRDFFLLALWTGARRSNVQGMRWQDLDLNEGIWSVPGQFSKNGDPLRIVLSNEAIEILTQRRREKVVSPLWVFPSSHSKTGHLVEPKKQWAKLLTEAGLTNLRPHDLRRTLGSWQARSGASLQIIQKTLNHRSIQSTKIYARLDSAPVKEALELATAALIKAGKRGVSE